MAENTMLEQPRPRGPWRSPPLPPRRPLSGALPGFVDQHQLLDALRFPQLLGSLQVLRDDLVDGVEDGHHRVLREVFGWGLLASRQVLH